MNLTVEAKNSFSMKSIHKKESQCAHIKGLPLYADSIVPPANATLHSGDRAEANTSSALLENLRHEDQKVQTQPQDRVVHFGNVTVRLYGRTLGDHPDCYDGPPLTLDWTYEECKPQEVCDYELLREKPCLDWTDLYITPNDRAEYLLSQLGFTEEDLDDAETRINKVRKQRRATYYIASRYTVEEEETFETSLQAVNVAMKWAKHICFLRL